MNKHLLEKNELGYMKCNKCNMVYWADKESASERINDGFIHSLQYKDILLNENISFLGFSYMEGDKIITMNEFTLEIIGENFCKYSDVEHMVKEIIL